MKEVTMTIKLPLFEPTKLKQEMYQTMRNEFSRLLNRAVDIKRTNPKIAVTDIDKLLKQDSILPTTTQQEARKLALSRYDDWKKNQKTKSFPRFKEKQTILFNNQNWHFRYDNGYLKLGIPTIEGRLTLEKYVPVRTNEYTSFWVHFLLNGEMDKTNKYYDSSFEQIIDIKKGNGQLYEKKKRWYFAFSITLTVKEKENTDETEKSVGVDRGLRMIAVAGCGQTGEYKIFNGRYLGHIRRKYHRLRKQLQKAKNMKALKRLENKEQRVIDYWNHVISKKIIRFAEQIGAKTIKLEDLSGIRKMKKHWKQSNRNIHSWAFYDLEIKIQYKAKLKGLKVEYVDPYKTSQGCFQCGKVKKTNRRGPLYTCSCGYKKQADVNASFVISTRPSIAG
ncbi:transposase [Anoxybacillus sp. FSL W8-0382]